MSDDPDRMPLARRGLMLVVSSPSGAGKTTLTRRLVAEDPAIAMSISVTTRPPRPGEKDGEDYRFLDREQFEAMRAAGDLLEHAEVFGHRYGTPRAPVERELDRGRDVLFDIDWQGAQQIRATMPDDLLTLFILPPSGRALFERLVRRQQDSIDTIKRRMDGAAREISHWNEYDYVVVNDDLEAAYGELRAVLTAGRLARHRRTVALAGHVERLEVELQDVLGG